MDNPTIPVVQRSFFARRTPVQFVAFTAAVVALVPYLLTMCPTFSFFDKGELAASAVTLGIPHPTGYPTFTMMGWVAVHVLFFLRPILALNIFAAVMVASSSGVLTLLFDKVLCRIPVFEENPRWTDRTRALCCGAGALLVAFSNTWWSVANGFEVYSFHTLMLSLLPLLFLRYVDREAVAMEDGKTGGFRSGMWFALMLGLSFTNHLTTVLLAPAFLFYYFRRLGFGAGAFLRLVYLVPWFLLGLIPYIYLPLRAIAGATINHTQPDTLERFIYHVTGRGFNGRMFSTMTVFRQQFTYFTNIFPAEVGYAGIVPLLIGLWYWVKHDRPLLVFSLLLIAATIVFSCNYAITDIDAYFLGAVLGFGLLCVAGIYYIGMRWGKTLALAIAVITVGINVGVNYAPNDEHDNYLVEDLAYNMINSLPKNAVLFTSNWAYWHAGSYYLQYAERFRPDVTVIDPSFLTLTWYVTQMRRNYPELMSLITKESDHYLQVSATGENRPGDTLSDEEGEAYQAMINALVSRAMDKRAVYATGDVVSLVGGSYAQTWCGLTILLTRDRQYIPQQFPHFRFRMWKRRVDPFAVTILDIYARALANRAAYERDNGNADLANAYVKYALTFDPGFSRNEIPDMPLDDERRTVRMVDGFNALRKQLSDNPTEQ